MKLSTRAQLFYALLLGLLCLSLWVFFSYFEFYTEEQEVYDPDKESIRADYEPFYESTRLMKRLGYQVESLEFLADISHIPQDATLFLSRDAFDSIQQTALEQELMAWVANGGHLVIPASEGTKDTFKIKPSTQESIYAKLGIEVIASRKVKAVIPHLNNTLDPHTQTRSTQDLKNTNASYLIDLKGERFTLREDGSRHWRDKIFIPFTVNDSSALIWSSPVDYLLYISRTNSYLDCMMAKDKDQALDYSDLDDNINPECAKKVTYDERLGSGYIFARLPLGSGIVSLYGISDDYFMYGESLRGSGAGPILVNLLGQDNFKPTIYFVLNGENAGLLGWLWLRYTNTIIIVGITLLGTLLFFIGRFGPMLLPERRHRPSLVEHIKAIAAYHLKDQRYSHMLAATRTEVKRLLIHLKVSNPRYSDDHVLLATLCQRPLSAVTEAMHQKCTTDEQFTRYMHELSLLLIELRKQSSNVL